MDIHCDFINIHGESAFAYSTVARWVGLFKAGRMSAEDEPRSGRRCTEQTSANIKRIEELIEEDPHITYDRMEDLSLLSRGTIERIVLDHLDFKKRASRWVPYQLSDQNKKKRFEFAKTMLAAIKNQEIRLDQIVTGDECWIYLRPIGKRSSSRAWRRKGEEPLTIPRRGRYEPKRMFSIFFRSTGPVLVHCVDKGKTIDHKYYIEKCLSPMIEEIKQQRPASGTRGLYLLHDNAKPHAHCDTVYFVQSNGMEIIDHPPYSPDLSPCDYWLFDYIKECLVEKGEFKDVASLAKFVTKVLSDIPHSEYRKTFNKYIERLENCVIVEGDYFVFYEHFIK